MSGRSPRTPPDPPEVTVSTAPAKLGRETLVAIAEAEADDARAVLGKRARSGPPTLEQRPAGRETLADIEQALRDNMPPPRVEQTTLDFHKTPLTSPVSQPTSMPRSGSAPEIESTGVQGMGRETLAAISEEVASEFMRTLSQEERSAWALQIAAAEVLEPVRFAVYGAPMLSGASDALLRSFAEARLLRRLPIKRPEDIVRIAVSRPNEDGAVSVEVWVRVLSSG